MLALSSGIFPFNVLILLAVFLETRTEYLQTLVKESLWHVKQIASGDIETLDMVTSILISGCISLCDSKTNCTSIEIRKLEQKTIYSCAFPSVPGESGMSTVGKDVWMTISKIKTIPRKGFLPKGSSLLSTGYLHEQGTVNAALGKPTNQSSIYAGLHSSVSSNAVDGNSNGDWKSNTCTHTGWEEQPWWKVDLVQIYIVYSVTITNRVDCCTSRLSGAEIRVGRRNDLLNVLCFIQLSTFTAGNTTLPCIKKPMFGRFVTVKKLGPKNPLTLCEVQVWGLGVVS